MPGKKDFVSVKGEEGRVHIQKRLVLTNLKEVCLLFKERFPTKKSAFPSSQSFTQNTAY